MISVYFDTETNNNKDVIELAMIKVENGEIIDIYHRFYFPTEKFSFMTSKIHGLYAANIVENRNKHLLEGLEYPKYFYKDIENLKIFLNGVNELVAHNLKYDLKFLPEDIKDKYDTRCTMKDNKKEVNALDKNGKLKNPKLEELAIYLGLEYDKDKAHGALYDVELLIQCDLEINKEFIQHQLSFDFN